MPATLEVRQLSVSAEGKAILRGVDLTIHTGELHALMGPNGSGKSTLALTLMGHPRYQVTGGQVLLDGQDIAGWPAERRAKAGLFLSFQYPPEVAGVPFAQFLRNATQALRAPAAPPSFAEFHQQLQSAATALEFSDELLSRSLNEGFSGGEKKRAEIVQLTVLRSVFAILDEPDSGLDIDSLKTVSRAIDRCRSGGAGVLVITHYPRLFQYLKPEAVHVFRNGRVDRSGGLEIAEELERSGYDASRRAT